MQVLGVHRAGEFDGVGGAADVDGGVALGGRRHVVDGGEMEEVVDLAAQLGDLVLLDAEQRPAQVADDRLDPIAGGCADRDAPALDEVVQARRGSSRAPGHRSCPGAFRAAAPPAGSR